VQLQLKKMTQSSCQEVKPTGTPAVMIDDAKCFKGLAEDLKKLAVEEVLSDVVIICEGDVELKAHRAVLVARSSVFQAMLTQEISGSIKIPDCKPEELRDFLQFLYHPKLESYDHAAKLLDLADKYQVATLKETCEVHLMSKVTKDNAMEMIQLASKHNSQYGLKQKAFDVIKKKILGSSVSIPAEFIDQVEELEKMVDAKLHLDSFSKKK